MKKNSILLLAIVALNIYSCHAQDYLSGIRDRLLGDCLSN